MNRRPTIYLHIGLPKTGSSALQQFFYENRERLMREGIFYPTTGRDGWAHHCFPASINGRNFKTETTFPEYLSNIFSEPDYVPGQAILLSSEAFHNIRQGSEIELLRNGLKAMDVKIIVYLRRQDYWIQSAYNQLVKSHRHRLTTTVKEYSQRKQLKNILDYSRFLKKWEDAFGFDSIIVKVYEKEQMPHGVFQSCMDIFNINLANNYTIPEGNVNPSLTPFAVKFLRLMNHIPMHTKMHNGLIRLLSKMPVGFVNKNYFSDHSLISASVRRQLLKKYESSNLMIAKHYLKRESGVLFYEKMP